MNGVWTGPVASALRADLNAGGSKFCGDCPLKLPLKKDETPPQATLDAGALPESPVHRVHGRLQHLLLPRRAARRRPASRRRARPACSTSISSSASWTRRARSLGRIDFFNYGEAFLHKRAVEMCEYIKAKFPHIYPLHEHERRGADARARAAAGASGIDEVTFSIDGATPGDLRAIPTARQLREGDRESAARWRTKRPKAGLDVPFLNWRYILFEWNDHDEEMERARKIATEIGVDRLSWEMTDHPEDAYLATLHAGLGGSSIASDDEVWDDSRLGNAIRGATPQARHRRPDAAARPAARRPGGPLR